MPEAETEALPLDGLPRRAAATAPGRAAIRFGAHALSYRDLDAAVDGFAAALGRRRPGTVVGVVAALHPAFPVAYFGAVRAGHICAVIDPGADLDELTARAGVELLVATAGMADLLRRIRVERDLDVIYLDQPGEPGGRTVATLARTHTRRRHPRPDLDAVACLRFGAHGRLVPLTHRNLTVGAAQAARAYGFERGSTVVNHLPTYEPVYLNAAVHAAATQVLCADPDPAGGVTLAGREAATHYCGLPAPLAKLAADPRDTHPRTTTVRAVLASGATLPPGAALRLANRVGAPLVQWYGPAGGPLTHCDLLDGPTAGSVGRPVPGTDCHVLAPPGKPGQVKVRGPQVATAMTDPDGWLRTGDIGYLDDHGALFLTQGVTA
ncbi:class I adenylate-forming enzyme family protein [Asanoa iriomotensis]|uniref:Long-chain-fatty-acid--CoA ligase n=1 Tax=Asanoa iriomotensis TaxID=234613 RepID=A0ABQ4BXM4_9ACTN|nr:AMP-binding protein [Asanoa iriomotensis]GIF55273.1 long-chain-fatty-acid--CoA ligase [Asanoa iriomotensis]